MRRGLTVYGLAAVAVTALALGLIALMVVGSIRYGGLADFFWRVRAEIAALRPHPQFAPTPLPTPTGWVEASLATPKTEDTPEVLFPATRQPASPAQPMATATRATPMTTTATSTPSPTPLHRPVAAAVRLTGFTHIWQKWNNCAPATLAMCLSQFGDAPGQDELAAALKGNPDDKNVSPEEIVAYATGRGWQATARVNGDLDRLRLLLSNGIPVIIESWLEETPNDGMGHYRLLTGYDDAARQVIVFDSYVSRGVRADRPYEGIAIPYDELLALWTVFNRTYIVVYTSEAHPVVMGILSEDADDRAMWHRALRQAQAEVAERPADPFAWFNLGTDLVTLGRYREAVQAYARARTIGLPWRMLWYQFGPFRAYYETGLYDELIALAEATIRTRGYVEEIYYWKGLGLAAKGNIQAARAAWQQALDLNPRYADAALALSQHAEVR